MDFIKKILENRDSSYEDLINCFEKIKENREVVVIKFDGERNEDEYTVFISFPNNDKRTMIRVDKSDLKMALREVLVRYVEEAN